MDAVGRGPALAVHPAADGGADAEQRAPLRVLVEEAAQRAGNGDRQAVRRAAVVRVGATGQDAAAQVDQAEVELGTPRWTPPTTGPPEAPMCRSTGICGRPRRST
ncbi:hypothetical protein ACWFR1_25930 [Streptomyces sp. NPDC055103]